MRKERGVDLEERLFILLDQMRNNEVELAQREGRKYHVHGLCAVLGYNPAQHDSYFGLEVGEDIFFKEKEIYVQDQGALQALEKAMEIDGAILIGQDGKLIHSGKYMLTDLRIYSRHEEAVATYQKLKETADAGTRHLSAVALSAQLPDLLFYILKSDHPQLRVFKGGSIYHSTVLGEAKHESLRPYRELAEISYC